MANYPLPKFHFQVDWAGTRIGFTDVSGLDITNDVIEYRDGASPEYHKIKMPGQRKFSNIVLKRGIFKSDNEFYTWFNTINMNTVQRRDITISLLDETHAPVIVWKVKNAWPTKITSTDLKADGNDVAIEQLDLAHEGFTHTKRISMFEYPFTGFHFLVVFEIFPQVPNDLRFQEVTGLNVSVNVDTYNEGGENRFVHRLPGRTTYSDLVLKRGMTLVSGVTAWCIDAIENFNYQPTNILVSLLNADHLPVSSWYIANAYPIKYEISGLNAENGQIVIESMTLRYEYYKTLNLSAAVGAAVGAVADLLGGASASVSISVA